MSGYGYDKGDDYIHDLIVAGNVQLTTTYAPVCFKKRIGGRTYDSSTMATLAIYAPSDVPPYAEKTETLYQTSYGAYLLVGEGQVRTPWAKRLWDCNDTVPAHGFLPLSKAEVEQWLELRGMDEEYFELFGDEGEDREQADAALCALPPKLAERLAVAAKATGLSASEWIEAKLAEALA